MYKTVFVAFFQGEQLKSRIKKVCAGFHATLYTCPSTVQERDEMLKGVRTRLEDLNLVLALYLIYQEYKCILFFFSGTESNARPQTKGFSKRCQGTPELDRYGSKDEGDLPHFESV